MTSDEELRRTFAAELRSVRRGGQPAADSCLDPETRAALAAIARAYPGVPWGLVDAAHDRFSAAMEAARRTRPYRRPPPRGPIVWHDGGGRATAYQDGQAVGWVQRHDYDMPRSRGEGDVRWSHAGSSYQAEVHGEPLGNFGSEEAAKAAVEDRFRR